MNEIKELPNEKESDQTEKVYVDWPDEDSDMYRFVSSRIDDVEMDVVEENYDVDDKINERYEDVSNINDQNSIDYMDKFVPPLDLISQNSSIEIPGAKGVIDIDLRSTISEDSLDTPEAGCNIALLPQVGKNELILNPNEYDTIRQVNERNKDEYLDFQPNSLAAFENAQEKMRYLDYHKEQREPTNSQSTSNPSKPKAKPTMQVAPQIKQQLHQNKPPNFIELNKATLAHSKAAQNSSYSNKFQIQKKESVIPRSVEGTKPIRPSIPTYDKQLSNTRDDYYSPPHYNTDNYQDNYREPTHQFPDNQPPNFMQSEPRLFYAMTKHGEPIIINTDNVIISNRPGMSPPIQQTNQYSQHPHQYYQYHQELDEQQHYQNHQYQLQPQEYQHHYQQQMITPNLPQSSPRFIQAFEKYPSHHNHSRHSDQHHLVRRSSDPENIHHYADPPLKRQPTLYNEEILNKKVLEVGTSDRRTISRFPPLSGSTSSVVADSQNENYGYAANFRKRDCTYDRYTLRDYRNLQNINRSGGLGSNVGSEEHRKMMEKLQRQKNYAKLVNDKNKMEMHMAQQQQKEEKLKSEQMQKDMDAIMRQRLQDSMMSAERDPSDREVNQGGLTSSNDNQVDIDNQEIGIHVVEKEPILLAHQPSVTNEINYKSAGTSREQMSKRDMMLNYAKSVKKRQYRKTNPNTSETRSAPAKSNSNSNSNLIHEMFNNDDLDRLLQRHEEDKKVAMGIRQKLGKIS